MQKLVAIISRAFSLLAVSLGLGAEPAPIRTAGEALALSPEALALRPPVHLRGIVTYCKSEGIPDVIIHDETGGAFIGGIASEFAASLRPGMVIEVEGTAGAGNFTPRIQATRVRAAGAQALPTAERVSFDELRSGRFDCRFVEAAGVVRTATIDRELQPPRLILRVATAAGVFHVWVLRFGNDDGSRLVDAAVRVRGVCLAWENPRRQLTSVRLLVNESPDIAITRAPNADPFAAPLSSPENLLRYHPEGLNPHRVRLRGVVTWQRAGESIVLQNDRFGALVKSEQLLPLRLGDEVEAAGFPALDGYSAALEDSVFRMVAHSGEPAPQRVTARQLLTDVWVNDVDQKLVRVPGTLRALRREAGEMLLMMESEGVSFIALAGGAENAAWTRLPEPGSQLELTGVCDIRPSERRRLVGGPPDGFALLLRSESDVRALRPGPWLNQRRLRVILGVSLGAFLVATLWAFALRQRVRRRTAQLAREIRSRHDAEVEFQAALGERARIAAELHDGLQQSLTAVALQLEAARLAAEKSPKLVPQYVEAARDLVSRSRDEVRQSVWNLRARTDASSADLVAELRQLAQGMTLNGGLAVEVRETGVRAVVPEVVSNHVLRIAQESLTNAVKHGGAARIEIEAGFTDSAFTLRISDDGSGFSPLDSSKVGRSHSGLRGMRERAERIGGKISIQSVPERGCVVTLNVPLQ